MYYKQYHLPNLKFHRETIQTSAFRSCRNQVAQPQEQKPSFSPKTFSVPFYNQGSSTDYYGNRRNRKWFVWHNVLASTGISREEAKFSLATRNESKMGFHSRSEYVNSGEIENQLMHAANRQGRSAGALEVCPWPRTLDQIISVCPWCVHRPILLECLPNQTKRVEIPSRGPFSIAFP